MASWDAHTKKDTSGKTEETTVGKPLWVVSRDRTANALVDVP